MSQLFYNLIKIAAPESLTECRHRTQGHLQFVPTSASCIKNKYKYIGKVYSDITDVQAYYLNR
jgi:hypothetical protein